MVSFTEKLIDLDEDAIAVAANDAAIAAELEEILLAEPANWIPVNCLITDKAGRQVSMRLNKAQIVVQQVKHRYRKAGLPVKMIILKARQMGITTEATADSFCDINTKCNRHAMIVAHKQDSSVDIFRRVRQMQDQIAYKRPEQYNNRREIQYDQPHNSKVEVQTAGNPDLGRGGTYHYVHGSEVAFWGLADLCLDSVMQTIPDANMTADTTVVLESTANGLGGVFYDMWCKATSYDPNNKFITLPKGESDWVAVFLPWHMFDDYRMPVAEGFKRTTFEHDVFGNESEEARLYDLDDEQLVWRRSTIKDKCRSDLDKFRQEYPACDREAFLQSGRPVFSAAALLRMMNRCKDIKTVAQGKFEDATIDNGVRVGKVEPEIYLKEEPDNPYPWLKIWQMPIRGIEYVIGADTCEGLDPTETNDPDSHSATVIRVDTHEMVAKLEGRFDPDLFAEQLDMLGRFYNNALLGFEINNTSGGSVRSGLLRLEYPNLYMRETYDEHSQKPTKKVGWQTDKATRSMMVSDGQHWIRDGRIIINDWQTVAQAAAWRYDKTGKPTHPDGEHDDDVISLLIAIQMLMYVTVQAGANAASDTERESNFSQDMVIGGCEGVRFHPADLIDEFDDEDDYY